jgi:hypothetical protein
MSRSIAAALALAALAAACRTSPTTTSGAGAGAGARPAAADLTTEAERSGYVRTGRLDEVVRLCPAFEAAHPGRARCVRFGTSPEGRPLLALVASADGTLDAETARARRRPVILVVAGIHAGEIEGKDAGFAVLRDALAGALAPGALSAVTVVFVPVFNVDGHERFGPNNRPNQRGPEAMGFRATAQRLNLNRDWVKADAPEMQAMLGLIAAWAPVVTVDLHTTDGAKFEHDVAVMVEPRVPDGTPLSDAGRALSGGLQARLGALGHLPTPFYPSFRVHEDPASGFDDEPAPARFSQAYAAARGRLGVLVETHSWATYPQRIKATRSTLTALLERAALDAQTWREAADAADAAGERAAGATLTLAWKVTGEARTIEFRGYAYEKRASEISGAPWIVYDETRPEIWRVPLYDQVTPALAVPLPGAGYLVPAAHAALVGEKLRLHGIRFEVLAEARAAVPVEAFRADTVTFAPAPFENRTRATVTGAWRAEIRAIPAGSLFVPIAQPRARLVAHLLEPTAADSLLTWGFFNAAFEQKEYMEPYVAEEEARAMLAADPALAAEFARRLEDPAFAKNPRARLDFFYRRHPAWDEQVNLYPVLRVSAYPPPR